MQELFHLLKEKNPVVILTHINWKCKTEHYFGVYTLSTYSKGFVETYFTYGKNNQHPVITEFNGLNRKYDFVAQSRGKLI